MILNAFLRDCGDSEKKKVNRPQGKSKYKKGRDVSFGYPDVVRRHGLQVVLKGLPPLEGGLELVHFDEVVYGKQYKENNGMSVSLPRL